MSAKRPRRPRRRAPRPTPPRQRPSYRRSHLWTALIQLAIVLAKLAKLVLLTIKQLNDS